MGTFGPLWNVFEAFLSVVIGLEGFEGMVIGWRKGVGRKRAVALVWDTIQRVIGRFWGLGVVHDALLRISVDLGSGKGSRSSVDGGIGRV